VVWNELIAKRELEEEAQRALSFPEHMRQGLITSALERAQNVIFNIIFRVPSLDEVLAKPAYRRFLMNLGAGASSTVPYTFSDPSLDLALISLDQRDTRFADELTAGGFVPIPSDNIADGPDEEGQEVFTIGFPSTTALLGQISQHPAQSNWSSSHFSLPVSSFGRVSMLHGALPFFWADMSIYPGNSGGPVVANDLLVGIVSAQALLPIEGVPNASTRIPFARIVKTSVVRSLLAAQEQKDKPPWLRVIPGPPPARDGPPAASSG
jgi:S1-C subfamily serine protease